MTDNEIIVALECCSNQDFIQCTNCPLDIPNQACSKSRLPQIALDLINRQRTEIIRLHIRLKDGIDLSDNVLKLVKSEAVKEFAKRLKKVISISDTQKPYFDKLVKEMAGDVHENKSV